MNEDRIRTLADAYGADVRRWPSAERAAAETFLNADRALADRLLFEARQLDHALNAVPRPMVAAALRDHVIALAERAGLRPRPETGLGWPRGALGWLSGAGWAAAACAGVVVGMVSAQPVTTAVQADAVLYQASLLGLDDEEVLG